MLTYLASWQRNRGASFERTANSAHPTLVPAQNFRTADGHLALFIGNDGMWRRFVDALGDTPLADERFVTREGRLEHRDEVLAHVQRVLLTATSREWERRLGAVGRRLRHGQRRRRCARGAADARAGLVVQNEHPTYGRYEHLRGPLPTHRARDAAPGAAPRRAHDGSAHRHRVRERRASTALRAAGIVS